MKKQFLLILISAQLTIYSMAQTSLYHPFPTNYGSWNYQYYDNFHNPLGSFDSFVTSGDTIIQSVSYKKLFWGSSYTGALRESNKIIYFYPDTSSHEYLLYNFNLSTGDTLFHPFGGTIFGIHDTLIVGPIDSILTLDGYHRRIDFSPTYTFWIEGIGSVFHFLRPSLWYNLSGDSHLECMMGDTGAVYPLFPLNSSYCIATSVSEESELKNKILLFPNPFHSTATLELKYHFENSELKVYNILGEQIRQQRIISQTTTIVRDVLSSGIYFYQVINSTGTLISGKFAIE